MITGMIIIALCIAIFVALLVFSGDHSFETWFGILWFFGFVVSLAFTIGVVYVAIHFISKYW